MITNNITYELFLILYQHLVLDDVLGYVYNIVYDSLLVILFQCF